MTLYMQKDKFQWGIPMPLEDRSGRTRYTVHSDAYALGKRLHVTDLAGREAIYIRQVIPSLFPKYEIEVYGRPMASIIKDLRFFHPRYVMEPDDWEISGFLTGSSYELSFCGTILAACRSQPGEDRLALEFHDCTEELTALGIILAVNCLLSPQRPRHS